MRQKLVILMLSLILVSSCTQNTDKSRISELEKQVAALQDENNDLKNQLQTLKLNGPRQIVVCKDQPEGTPVITSLSSNSGSVGDTVLINGCNFSGFEGDKLAWIEDLQGKKGILYSESGSTSKLLRVTLKPSLCQRDVSYSGEVCDSYLDLKPGRYRIYVNPWGKESNMIEFTINK